MPSPLALRALLVLTLSLVAPLAFPSASVAQPNRRPASPERTGAPGPESSKFQLLFDRGAITGLRYRGDDFDTDYISAGARLGDTFVRYRTADGPWRELSTSDLAGTAQLRWKPAAGDGANLYDATYTTAAGAEQLELQITYEVEADAVLWQISLRNLSEQPLEVGDLAFPFPMDSQFRRGRPATESVLKHSLVSGHNSFMFWMRPNSAGPYLTLTPTDDAKLECWDRQRRGGYRAYIHSSAAGAEAKERGTNWRQPNTSVVLAPQGDPGAEQTYGFKLQWSSDYDDVRQTLVDEGLIDVQIAPGMTVPNDLFAEFALRTNQSIHEVQAEFPDQTSIEPLGKRGEYELYRVKFEKLGENRLTIRYGDGRETYLEFFSTEPLETLIKKRAAFIAGHQHRDPKKWYDGLLAEWANDTEVLLGPDNYDRIRGWRIYAVTCDDPGLSKPAYLASKLAEYPTQSEIDALDYYIENFVWGGLQMTTAEAYPYAIYGIPDWKRNRDSEEPGRNGRRHLWRIYDYPHIALMYHRMYRVAKNNPQLQTALTAQEYLDRAYGTAVAMFTVPVEIEGWRAYNTGLYNELAIPDVIEDLVAEGEVIKADRLRDHWERKVRYFVTDQPDLFGSEYPFDSTGFESTHAFAKYALEQMAKRESEAETTGDEASANNRRRERPVTEEAAQEFLELQMAANIFCRGWIEATYYYLGSDYRGGAGDGYTLSYMSQMGGWAVLDYALQYAKEPDEYLRLGYASYLSAWALMNTGTPESGYGYWFPGEASDGAAGGGFEPSPYGRTWLEQPHTRGSWYYSCEIDLGYCGALRAAATVLADDDVFGRICYGGVLEGQSERLQVVPRDGVRRRFHAMLDSGELHMELQQDRLAADQPILLMDDLSVIEFQLESDNQAAHTARLVLSGAPGEYQLHGPEAESIFSIGGESNVADLELALPAGARPARFSIERVAAPSGGAE